MAIEFWDDAGTPVSDNELTAQESTEGQPAVDGEGEGGTLSAATPSPDAEALPEHMTPEQAYGSMKHFQAQRDTQVTENEALKQELAQQRAVTEALTAKGFQATVDDNVKPTITRPDRPSRPKEDYGESFDRYAADMDRYYDDMETYRDLKAEEVEMRIQTRENQYNQQRQLDSEAAQYAADAQFEFGLRKDLAQQLAEDVKTGKLTTQDPNFRKIVALGYQAVYGNASNTGDAQAQQMRTSALTEREQHRLPPTAASTPSTGSPPVDDISNPNRRITPIKMWK